IFSDDKKEMDSIKELTSRYDIPQEEHILLRWMLEGPEEQVQKEMRNRMVE
ncbi:hypothetical protein SK128_025954, partial [Halocaridina rubra]